VAAPDGGCCRAIALGSTLGAVASGAVPREPDRSWVPYAAMWLPWVGLYAAGLAAAGVPTPMALRGALASVLPWAGVGLLVPRAARALPWPDERRTRVLAAHVAIGVAFAAVTTALWIGLLVADQRLVAGAPTASINWRIVPWQMLTASLVYAALVSVAYARQNAARVREETARATRSDLLRATAELAALRSQLNPHFILNTLHTLLGLVRRDPAAAEQAIEHIGDLLRYGLRLHREGIDEVTLGEEWEFVRGYLELERLRLGDRLRLRLLAEDTVMDCLVPAFALQPLVENAIRHAIAPRAAGGSLDVVVQDAGDRLLLRVTDDGPGLVDAPSEGQGLGLRLLRERLDALYGSAARLTLRSSAGGLAAEIDLPVHREAE
jgi:signal transduction histidine kinase